jgi:hypothetical protein
MIGFVFADEADAKSLFKKVTTKLKANSCMYSDPADLTY